MLKIFRKIRLKSIGESRLSKYMIYAVGEIVLVVIGILIALAINNWNENQKDINLEENYYCRILEDFELDKILLVKSIDQVDQKIERGKQLLLDLYLTKKDKFTLLNDWIKTLRLEVYVPRKIAFEDLTSSGNLKLLRNVELKNNLAQYYSNLENIVKQINQNRDELVQRSYPVDATEFGVQEFDYMKSSLGSEIIALLPNVDWMHDQDHPYFKKFQNDLVFTLAMYERHIQHLNRILQEMETPYSELKQSCIDTINE